VQSFPDRLAACTAGELYRSAREGVAVAMLAGELVAWPSKEGLAALLRAAGLAVTVGRYSVRIEGHCHFKFQEYGGDLGEPVIEADAQSVAELLTTARLVSEALGRAGVVHRFELYDDGGDELAGYLHHGWPRPEGE
jgi:hypothetical protein